MQLTRHTAPCCEKPSVGEYSRNNPRNPPGSGADRSRALASRKFGRASRPRLLRKLRGRVRLLVLRTIRNFFAHKITAPSSETRPSMPAISPLHSTNTRSAQADSTTVSSSLIVSASLGRYMTALSSSSSAPRRIVNFMTLALLQRHSERSRGIPWHSCQVTSRDISTSLDMTD